MTTYPNKMSDEELLRCIKNITFDVWEDNVSYDVAAELILQLLKQHREAYALELIGEDEDYLKGSTHNFEAIYDLANDFIESKNILRAELREKVGRDE